MRHIICEKIKLLQLRLTPQPSQEEDLSAVSQVYVCAAGCVSGEKTSYCSRKTFYPLLSVDMLTSLNYF